MLNLSCPVAFPLLLYSPGRIDYGNPRGQAASGQKQIALLCCRASLRVQARFRPPSVHPGMVLGLHLAAGARAEPRLSVEANAGCCTPICRGLSTSRHLVVPLVRRQPSPPPLRGLVSCVHIRHAVFSMHGRGATSALIRSCFGRCLGAHHTMSSAGSKDLHGLCH